MRTCCRYLLVAVFLMAALSKFTDLSGFTDSMILHAALPPVPARFAAALVPSLELVCGLCLFFGVAVREGATILSLLLVVFLAYQLLNRSGADCGCLLFPEAFRAANQWPWPVARNAVLLVVAAGLTRKPPPLSE